MVGEVNFNALNIPDIGGTFMNAFHQGAQMKREHDARNALGAIVQNPNDQAAWGTIMKADPATGMQAKKYFAEEQRKAQLAGLMPKAAAGDPAALQQVMGIDFDTWKSLDASHRQQIKGQSDYVGQSALRIAQLPEDQRPAAWDAAVQQGVQLGYQGLAPQVGKYSPQGLQAAIDNAGLVDKYISLAEPKYMAIPAGGTLVDTHNPQAVGQFGASSAQAGGVQEGATATNPQTGQKIQFKGGQWVPMQGGPQVAPAGNFRP